MSERDDAPDKPAGSGFLALARARLRTRPDPAPASSAPYTLRCPGCGAPRTSNLDLDCRYCGGRTTE